MLGLRSCNTLPTILKYTCSHILCKHTVLDICFNSVCDKTKEDMCTCLDMGTASFLAPAWQLLATPQRQVLLHCFMNMPVVFDATDTASEHAPTSTEEGSGKEHIQGQKPAYQRMNDVWSRLSCSRGASLRNPSQPSLAAALRLTLPKLLGLLEEAVFASRDIPWFACENTVSHKCQVISNPNLHQLIHERILA